ncbi:MAG: transglutaminase family protein [Rhodospirillaceae bacterium]|nr:transglutaminase family protein [Rhodospirillaceae bacterium]
MTRAAVEEALRRIGEGADRDIDLAGTALLCAAHEDETIDLEICNRHLEEIETQMQRAAALDALKCDDDGLDTCCDTLRYVMAEKLGYGGAEQDYDDLRNADLAQVIQRRRGLPVALSILYIHAARALAWRIEGINFPGHFLIRLHGEKRAAILDPFHGGITRSIRDLRQLLKAQSTEKSELKPEHFGALENRQVLLRLQNNIKVRRIQEGDLAGAERALQRMLWLAPGQADLWRESGILNIRLDNLLAARRALTRYLDLAETEQQRQRAARLLQELSHQLH